jgi:hypothetical protein
LVDRAEPVRTERILDDAHRRLVPARVDDADVAHFQPERHGREPVQVCRTSLAGDLLEKGPMLVLVLLVARAKVLAGPVRMLDAVSDSVEFVIAHDDLGAAVVDHPLDQLQNLHLLRAAVDEVADEDRLAFRMAIGAGPVVAVTQAFE